ncbi:hypothetical protein HZS_952 [Henneguya salminicola]|nr:hypothetical protein HZS_952 [Henneguya salminicola]
MARGSVMTTIIQIDTPPKNLSHIEKVVLEIIETEEAFYRDIKSIVDNYKEFFDYFNEKHIFFTLRNHLSSLLEFSSSTHKYLLQNKDDISKICEMFILHSQEFSQHFGNYCEIYPLVISILETMYPGSQSSQLIKKCWTESMNLLPLSSYLLKPVQRVLKYHLLLSSLESDKNIDPFIRDIVLQSVIQMKAVADVINEKPRLQDGLAELPRLRRKIINLTEPLKFNDVGPVLLQSTVFINGRKKRLILFENVLLIAYIDENDQLSIKEALIPSNIVLLEKAEKDPCVFSIHRQSHAKKIFIIKTKDTSTKSQWILHIKRLILKSFGVNSSDKRLVGLFGKENTDELIYITNCIFNHKYLSAQNLRNMDELVSSLEQENEASINDSLSKIVVG